MTTGKASEPKNRWDVAWCSINLELVCLLTGSSAPVGEAGAFTQILRIKMARMIRKWYRRIRLFGLPVWRENNIGVRIPVTIAWRVAKIIHD